MDPEQPPARTPGSLSVGRAIAVLVGFVVAVAVLVAWGTRPSVSTTPLPVVTTTTAAGTTTTAAGGTATTTPTTAATTTTARGRRGDHTTTTTVAPSSVSVTVANATSTSGLAAHYSAVIGAGGWAMQTPVDANTTEATSAVYYAAGFQPEATTIAHSIGVAPTAVAPLTSSVPVSGASGSDVVVLVGQDLATSAAS